MAILLVEQHLDIADHLIVMERGEVVVDGPTSEVDEGAVRRYLMV
jgi:urea transport system ATP-binding protein